MISLFNAVMESSKKNSGNCSSFKSTSSSSCSFEEFFLELCEDEPKDKSTRSMSVEEEVFLLLFLQFRIEELIASVVAEGEMAAILVAIDVPHSEIRRRFIDNGETNDEEEF